MGSQNAGMTRKIIWELKRLIHVKFLFFSLNLEFFSILGDGGCHAAAQINRRGVLLFAPPEIVFNSEAGNIFCELVLKFLIRHFS